MEKGEISKQQFDAAQANADATASALKADEEKFAQAKRSVEIAKAQLEGPKDRLELLCRDSRAAIAHTELSYPLLTGLCLG